ncbi:MAG: glycosyltransferase [Crocinitomicaceae bacterium]|nr:glycosyltransferase [Crocinitomicaceae bacterium]
MAKAKVVFLYTEIAGYFLACVEELSKSADVLIVRWPVNKEAPFNFSEQSSVKIIDRKEYTDDILTGLIHDFNPDILVCSGWLDKGYLKIAKSFHKKIPVVVSLDNHWTGSVKQRIACLLSPFYLKNRFTHAWVPGKPQEIYAKKLGFGSNILLNFYCADTPLFNQIFENTFHLKNEKFPHRFLYVARYVEHKGIFEMWQAFKEFSAETDSDWELWCLGTGDQWENRMQHPKISHIGFVQPNEMEKYIRQTSVYILPSKFEPWGVSLQEFAICGFPILVSDKVGSASKFLNDNGMQFEAGNVEEIKNAFKTMASKSDAELLAIGKRSHALGMTLTPADWTKNLLSLLQKK